MDQQRDLSRAGGVLDLVGAVDQVACPRFHAETIKGGLPQRLFGALAEIGGKLHIIRFERALQCWLELALGVRPIEFSPVHADPCAAARRTGTDVGSDNAVRPEGEPDQFILGAFAAGEDARPFGDVRLSIC
jgi:hypothetical protein